MNLVHQEDYKVFKLSVEDYMQRYFIGHYNPAGNHFFAFSIKDTIVKWLDPKPITYRNDKSRMIDFKGYLPEIPSSYRTIITGRLHANNNRR
jgi:hypothetical protein